jgi:hypothetical protein
MLWTELLLFLYCHQQIFSIDICRSNHSSVDISPSDSLDSNKCFDLCYLLYPSSVPKSNLVWHEECLKEAREQRTILALTYP